MSAAAAYEAFVIAADAAAAAYKAFIAAAANTNPDSFTTLKAKAEITLKDLKMAHKAYNVHIEAKATEPEPKRRC